MYTVGAPLCRVQSSPLVVIHFVDWNGSWAPKSVKTLKRSNFSRTRRSADPSGVERVGSRVLTTSPDLPSLQAPGPSLRAPGHGPLAPVCVLFLSNLSKGGFKGGRRAFEIGPKRPKRAKRALTPPPSPNFRPFWLKNP